jgi:hypothetical protein
MRVRMLLSFTIGLVLSIIEGLSILLFKVSWHYWIAFT